MSLFVCIEGVDGAGKTTVSQALASAMDATYYKCPGGPYAEARRIVDEVIDPLTRYFFYRTSVQYDSGCIRELLKAKSVVCDRFIYSTVVYHAAMDDRVRALAETTGLLVPDHVFILTANEETLKRRLAERHNKSVLEKDLSFQRKVDELFRAEGFPMIDTTNTQVGDIVDTILRSLSKEGRG